MDIEPPGVNAVGPRGILTLHVNDSLMASKGQLSAIGDRVRQGATQKFIWKRAHSKKRVQALRYSGLPPG